MKYLCRRLLKVGIIFLIIFSFCKHVAAVDVPQEHLLLENISYGAGLDFDGSYVVWMNPARSVIYCGRVVDNTIQEQDIEVVDQSGANIYCHINIHYPIVTWTQGPGMGNIFMKNMETGETTQLTDDPADQWTPRVHTDWVVWMGQFTRWKIFVYNIESGAKYSVPDEGADHFYPRVHGDIAVWEIRLPYDYRAVRAFDLSSQTYISIPPAGEGTSSGPDVFENKIVWKDSRHGNNDIYAWVIGESEEIRITDDPSSQSAPRIDGDLVVYDDSRHGNGEIYAYGLTTGIEIRITDNSVEDVSPRIGDHYVVWNRPTGDTTANLYGASVPSPTANAGSDQTICNQICDEVTLDGNKSDDSDGTIVSYEWSLEHRDNPIYNTTTSGISPTVSGLQAGIYDVTLTVTDDDGLTDTDTMVLTVLDTCNPCNIMKGDLDGDGDLDADDLAKFAENFGKVF